jgi:hypothetical protein
MTMRSRGMLGPVRGFGSGLELLAHEGLVADDFHAPGRQRRECWRLRARPVRRLKQAWCHGQRTSSPATKSFAERSAVVRATAADSV